MDLKITNKTENKALGRTEMACELSFEKAMPSRKQIREAICAATGVAPELLIVVSAKGQFGTNGAKVLAHAYKDANAMNAERKYLLVRDGLAEKEKKQAAAKAPAKK
jgi:ribosomal protein S24E